jgi:hypothetical protein
MKDAMTTTQAPETNSLHFDMPINLTYLIIDEAQLLSGSTTGNYLNTTLINVFLFFGLTGVISNI